jgi:acyl-coenzyme A thioesterase PaaI-like protein
MAIIRIHNADWGFETNCFVCEPRNVRGLRIPFFHDTEREVVFAEFELGNEFSGAPTVVHGGVTLAVLDEAMAWACIAIGKRWAVTSETTTRFHRAVHVDKRYRVEAEVTGHDDPSGQETSVGAKTGMMHCTARVLDRHDQVRAEASATFTTLGEAQATRVGAVVDETTRGYVDG